MTRRSIAVCLVGAAVLLSSAWAAGTAVESSADSDGGILFDAAVARWVAEHAPGSERVMEILTWLGSSAFVLPVLLVTALVIGRRPEASVMRTFLVLAAIGLLFPSIVKGLVQRPRPAVAPLVGYKGSSFPSGHATAGAIVFPALAYVLAWAGTRRVAIAVWMLAAAMTLVVGATRVMLGVHWVTDVVGGVLLGAGWVAVAALATRTMARDGSFPGGRSRRDPRGP